LGASLGPTVSSYPSEPVFQAGDLVRLIEPKLPPPFAGIAWSRDLRPGMEGVVLGGPQPCKYQLPFSKTRHPVYINGRSRVVISIAMEKIDGPPPEEADTPRAKSQPPTSQRFLNENQT
jgi:hypothetical protein